MVIIWRLKSTFLCQTELSWVKLRLYWGWVGVVKKQGKSLEGGGIRQCSTKAKIFQNWKKTCVFHFAREAFTSMLVRLSWTPVLMKGSWACSWSLHAHVRVKLSWARPLYRIMPPGIISKLELECWKTVVFFEKNSFFQRNSCNFPQNFIFTTKKR